MKRVHLNRQLVLEAPLRSQDGSGGYAHAWQPLGTLWAQVTGRGGREVRRAGNEVSETNWRIVVRAAPSGDPARPAPDQRFREGDRVYSILAVIEEDSEARYLTCYARERTVT